MNRLSCEQGAAALQAGEIIAYPTEGVMGLGCDPCNEAAVMRLLALKRRPIEKGLILVGADLEQLRPLMDASRIEADHWARLSAGWPGPVTFVVPASERVPAWIRGRFVSVALRASAHPVVQRLCREFGGPIVSTSANLSGEAPARACDELSPELLQHLAGCVAGAIGDLQGPTPIIDVLTGRTLR
ncbi:translation factor SUA5 [Sulfurivirga caldicuralii]|uniref:Threonylcarbamoyl-AMP synthase n=1 Tax=Sulfurivirga caldicuralii TaxID=364032 RepID=A0A1N6HA80_9GAMM|nr:Sua5/YciO/YrdC/YwlC family protein [Sulfurivirga caldicuralii]SIO16738.1 translation factor SUA5 [Sulfurivirga caldicuralii]